MTNDQINTKILAGKIVSVLIMIAMIVILAGCGGSLSGTYESEDGNSMKFTSSGKCTLYEKDGSFYNGTYKKTDKGYEITMQTPLGPYGVLITEDGKDLIKTDEVPDGVEMNSEGGVSIRCITVKERFVKK